MEIQRALEQLGYHHNEIIVYLALLKLGEGTVTQISHQAQLPRSTTQFEIQELQKKGLVSLSLKHLHQIWLPESPSRILSDLHKKEHLLLELLPELQAIRGESKDKPILKFFDGNGIEAIFDEILLSKYPIKILGSVSYMSERLGKEFVEGFLKKLFSRLVPVQLLTTSSKFVEELKTKCHSDQNRVCICNDERLRQVVYILFNNHVALILLNVQESTGVIFDNPGFAETSALLFKSLWNDSLENK